MTVANLQAMPIRQVNVNGILTGAKNVDVGGKLFDVAFVDGTCIDVFSGCDSNEDFAIRGSFGALLDQVFVDTPIGNFGSHPGLISGCGDLEICFLLVPIGLGDEFHRFLVFVDSLCIPGGGCGEGGATNIETDYSQDPQQTWAVWSPSQNEVDSPGTMLCLGIGRLALVLAQRRSRPHSAKG